MNIKYKKYIDYIVNDIEPPYLKSLEPYGLKQEEYEMILSKVYNQPVNITGRIVYDQNGNTIYYEDSYGFWYKQEYDSNGNIIYYETSNRFWRKSEYDTNGNLIYYKNSNGDWVKYEYDINGYLIYYEDSTGDIRDYR